ncbi:hypothetical protein H072_1031 [Dactylellina haptotyla CBS 200.50]|uniref:Uncharacterized protein n=1 Tax=Dactylellina haptotyla (strain CBS 200.50) TaxID=1284197 RepID=S8C003_DACHA|nr:hypothetical protein H072_1031 [Dactylellina haptotyla CBS 200.50]
MTLLERQRGGKKTKVKQGRRTLTQAQIENILETKPGARQLQDPRETNLKDEPDIQFITPSQHSSGASISADVEDVDFNDARNTTEGTKHAFVEDDVSETADEPSPDGDDNFDSTRLCEEVLEIAEPYDGFEEDTDETPAINTHDGDGTIEEYQTIIADGMENLSMGDGDLASELYDEPTMCFSTFPGPSRGARPSRSDPTSHQPSQEYDDVDSERSNNLKSDKDSQADRKESLLWEGDKILKIKANEFSQPYKDYIKHWTLEAHQNTSNDEPLTNGPYRLYTNAQGWETAFSPVFSRGVGVEPLPSTVYQQILGQEICFCQGCMEKRMEESMRLFLHFRSKGVFLALAVLATTINFSEDEIGHTRDKYLGCMFNLLITIILYGPRHFFTAHIILETARFLRFCEIKVDGFCHTGIVLMLYDTTLQVFSSIGMSHHTWALEALQEANGFEINNRFTAIEFRENVRRQIFQKCGPYDPRTIFAYSELVVWMTKSNEEYVRNRGSWLAHLIRRTITARDKVHLTSRHEKWLLTAILNIGTAFVQNGEYEVAIKVLKLIPDWKTEKDWISFERDIDLAAAYRKMQRNKQSLEILFKSLNRMQVIFGRCRKHRSQPDLKAISQVKLEIARVVYERGPQLHYAVDLIFRDTAKDIKLFQGYSPWYPYFYQSLWKAWSALRSDRSANTTEGVEEHRNMLSVQPLKRASTPTFHDYLYYQGVSDWLYSQNVTVDPEGMDVWTNKTPEIEDIGLGGTEESDH